MSELAPNHAFRILKRIALALEICGLDDDVRTDHDVDGGPEVAGEIELSVEDRSLLAVILA